MDQILLPVTSGRSCVAERVLNRAKLATSVTSPASCASPAPDVVLVDEHDDAPGAGLGGQPRHRPLKVLPARLPADLLRSGHADALLLGQARKRQDALQQWNMVNLNDEISLLG